jgi:hypothetical protein
MLQTAIYYIILYVIVIAINYFKLKKQFKIQDDSTPTIPFNWKEIFFVSNEIIYTASGVYIILLENQSSWIAPIVGLLLLLTLISTNIAGMNERFSQNALFNTHIAIIIVVVLGTCVAFYIQFRINENIKTQK